MGFLQRLRKRRALRPKDWPPGNGHRPRGSGRRLREDGLFSSDRRKDRVARRREFRVSVSGNRKWIFIGLAVIAACATIVYLSVTYGGGLMRLLL